MPTPPEALDTKAPLRRTIAVQRLAERFDTDFVADYFSEPYQNVAADPLPTTLDAALAMVAQSHATSWMQRRGLLLVRNSRWYRNIRLEVDPADLDALAGIVPGAGPEADLRCLPDRSAYPLAHLSNWQIANGLRYYTDESRMDAFLAKKTTGNPRNANLQPVVDTSVTALTYRKTHA